MKKAIGISFITVLMLFLGSPTSSYAAPKKNKQCGTTVPDSVSIRAFQCFLEYQEKDKNGDPKMYWSDKDISEKTSALSNGDVTEERVWLENGRCLVTYSVRAIVNGNSKNFRTTCWFTPE